MVYNVYDVLAYVDGSTYEVRPKVADQITSTDGQTWTVHIRPGVKFSDGTPYDANAVKAAWERFADPKTASAAVDAVADITSMTAPDPLTLRVSLKSVSSQWPRIVAGRIAWIPSPTAIKDKGDQFAQNPIGAGPFILTGNQQPTKLVFQRNPNYWDAPRPYLDQISYVAVPDEIQRTNAMKAGEFDLDQTYNDQVGAELAASGLSVISLPANGGWSIMMNIQKAPFDDLALRKGIFQAIDRNRFSQVTAGGNRPMIDTLENPGGPTYDANIKIPGYNKDAAQAAFDAYAAKTGGPVTATFQSFNNPNLVLDGQEIVAQLNSYRNVKIALSIVGTVAGVANLNAGTVQLTQSSLRWQDPMPEMYTNLLCANANTPGNWSRFCNTEMEKQLDILRTSLDPAARVAAAKQAERILIDQVPYAFLSRYIYYWAGKKNVQDVTTWYDAQLATEKLWVDK